MSSIPQVTSGYAGGDGLSRLRLTQRERKSARLWVGVGHFRSPSSVRNWTFAALPRINLLQRLFFPPPCAFTPSDNDSAYIRSFRWIDLSLSHASRRFCPSPCRPSLSAEHLSGFVFAIKPGKCISSVTSHSAGGPGGELTGGGALTAALVKPEGGGAPFVKVGQAATHVWGVVRAQAGASALLALATRHLEGSPALGRGSPPFWPKMQRSLSLEELAGAPVASPTDAVLPGTPRLRQTPAGSRS